MSDRNKRVGSKGKSPRTAGRRAERDSGDRTIKGGARLSSSNVGRVLRTAYDDALREPVPDEFHHLLGKLD